MTHPMARDGFEHLVAGDMLMTTIGDFKLRAARIIEEEHAKANPDNHLIAFACDAIRLSREFARYATRWQPMVMQDEDALTDSGEAKL